MRRAAVLLLPAILCARAHAAPPASPYAPSPAGFASLTGSREEEELAARAVAAIDAVSPEEGRRARDDLLSAGGPGTRAAAAALATATPSPEAEVRLLQVLAASARPEVDVVLARAATRPRFEVRALAGQALGAGRTAEAVETLASLARDDVPAVRGAALRGLFAIESPAAEAARLALPSSDAATTALRLRLHRLRGDERPALAALAFRTWATSPSAAARTEAARCLALPGLDTSTACLAWVAWEASGAPTPWPVRGGRIPPDVGRLAAAEALSALLARHDLTAAARAGWLRLGAGWVAHPVRAEGIRADGLAHDLLLQTLPEAGEALVAPVTALLLAEAFDTPPDGTTLLASLDEAVALPALRALADPRRKAPESTIGAAFAALRDLGRIGDADVAAALLDRANPVLLRTDAVHALRRDSTAVAIPLLASVASDPEDTGAVASEATKVLLTRPEPEARAAVEAALLDGRWQQHESDRLRTLVAQASDADWAFLERALAAGPAPLRDAIFDAMRYPSSKLRGPRAVAFVHTAQEMLRVHRAREASRAGPLPPLGIDDGSVARALCAVAPAEGLAFVRSKWKGPDPASRTLLRNLQTVRLKEAGEFALEVAGTVPDDDAVTLGVVTTVLGGECEKDPERFDPLWRRCLSAKDERVVNDALRELDEPDRSSPAAAASEAARPRFPRKPLAPLLLAIVAGPPRPPGVPPPPGAFGTETRISALKAVLLEPSPEAEPLLARLAFDDSEDESLRQDAAKALVARASPPVREQALVWLEAPSSDGSSDFYDLARTAGRGASPAGAARLLALLVAALEKRFASPPYFRPGAIDDATADRIDALGAAIGETHDPATLDAVAGLLFDPRFARFAAETMRAQWLGFPAAAGPLSPLLDPAPFPTQLRQGKSPTAEALPMPAAPRALEALRVALCADGPDAAVARISRAAAEARAAGRLARFPDAYLAALARQLRAGDARDDEGRRVARPDFSAAAEALEVALPWTAPSGTAEEVDARMAPVLGHVKAGRFEAAARAQTAAVALAARTGLCDVEPGPDAREDEARLASWRRLRAAQDAYEGAAAAAAGKPEEARDAFARALRRTPGDAETLKLLADLRALVKFDLAAAEADARRALALRMRTAGEVAAFRRSLANVLRVAGKPDAARRALEGLPIEDSGD